MTMGQDMTIDKISAQPESMENPSYTSIVLEHYFLFISYVESVEEYCMNT